MGISVGYGPNSGLTSGLSAMSARNQEEEERFQQYLQMLQQIGMSKQEAALAREEMGLNRELQEQRLAHETEQERRRREYEQQDRGRNLGTRYVGTRGSGNRYGGFQIERDPSRFIG